MSVFILTGAILILFSVAKVVIIYSQMLYIKKEYARGNKYEDEYGTENDKLKAKLSYCGILFLVGFIISIFDYILSTSF